MSLQYHKHREECWLLVSGDAYATVQNGSKRHTVPLKKGRTFVVAKKHIHRLGSRKGGIVVEVAYGDFDEKDIVRLEDDYGRVPKIHKRSRR